MTTLTINRGVPGSGKSTWARAQAGNPVIVSRDTIREAIFGTSNQDYYQIAKEALRKRENLVTVVQNEAIAEALRAGIDVIVDNTSIKWAEVRSVADIGFKAGAHVEVKVFDVPLSVAIERNARRAAAGGRDVPRKVIEDMHSRFQHSKNMVLEIPERPVVYNGTPGKPKAVLVDVDGTLAHMNGKRGPFDWHNVHLDDVDEVVAELVYDLRARGYKIVIMSGRDGSCEELTKEWLEAAAVYYDAIFMRAPGDMRKDSIVKAELFDNHVRYHYDVQFVLDDRNQVVDMWRSMGIKTLQVAEGDF